MESESVLGIVILIVLILAIGSIGLVMYFNSNSDNNVVTENSVNSANPVVGVYSTSNNPKYSNAYSTSGYVYGPCGQMYGGECFIYSTLDNKRLEPCPTPRPACSLCFQGLEQQKGYGHMDNLAQDRLNC